MNEEDVFTQESLDEANSTRFKTIDAYGGKLKLGTLSTADMMEWVDSNEDKTTQRLAGLRLLVKSIVFKDGTRIDPQQFDKWLVKFKNKDAKENGKCVAAALELNGYDTAARLAAKNAQSEAATSDASPSASPSPAAEQTSSAS